MKVEKISLTSLAILSDLLKDYLNLKPEIAALYDYAPRIDSFEQIIKDRASQPTNRRLLVEELQKQYQEIGDKALVLENIEQLADENTFTVTTAHQLCLFTGPLYFVYKALSAIKLAAQLKEKFPAYNFVPVFWLGSEDHDFEEINHLHVYDKKITWQSEQEGAVGMMRNKNFRQVIDALSKILYNGKQNDFIDKLNAFFPENEFYGKSYFKFIHYLFGVYGLVVLEQNNKAFKKSFTEIMQTELDESLVENNIENELNLIDANYKVQAKPRSVNLFYMKEGLRERILKKDNQFFVNNTSIKFTKNELIIELETYPERFSPNVLLRPLYQEFLLPNLAYVGGGGELAYWLQLKSLFHSQARKLPMLLLRDMAVQINAKTARYIAEIVFDKKCLFKNKELLISDLVKNNSSNDLSVEKELQIVGKMFISLRAKASNIDKSLEQHVIAQQKVLENKIATIEKKLLRAEKKNHAVLVRRIEAIYEQLFPHKKLQERYVNFAPYYKKYKSDWFDFLLKEFNPLEAKIKLIFHDNSI